MRIQRIISGGQTGADRAALDWAITHGIPHGGWCPAGREAEDGAISDRYQLQVAAGGYLVRTKANVRDSDGTLIVALADELEGGSLSTARYAARIKKPCLHVHPAMDWNHALSQWLQAYEIYTLNVAGPRESKEPMIGDFVTEVLDALIPIGTGRS